jgi:hypothetical protein
MKTLTDLLELVNKAIEQTDKGDLHEQTLYHVFFVDFSGHVNQLDIRYYSIYNSKSDNNHFRRCKGYLNNEEQIQELYWFLKNRLKG